MDLDAHILTNFQSCQRRFVLDQQYAVKLWRPHTLFNACLRMAIFHLSQGGHEAEDLARQARVAFMQTAAMPGLDVDGDPYRIAKDWCVMFDTILRCLARTTLPKVALRDPLSMKSWLTWQPFAWADDSGQLHRWITVDRWDPDALLAEAHSWYAMGDMAVYAQPLTLHVIVIGQQRNGRRASLFARAWRHPGLKTLPLRYKHFPSWDAVYLADDKDADLDSWVDGLFREPGVIQSLFHHQMLELPSEAVLGDTRRQILAEGMRMRALLEEGTRYSTVPMSRGACDGYVPCPFQYVCYNEKIVDPEELGLYKVKTVGRGESQHASANLASKDMGLPVDKAVR